MPPPLVALHEYGLPSESVVRTEVPQPVSDVTPDSGSLTAQDTVTSLRYQPFEPRVPTIVGVITGPVASSSLANVHVLAPDVRTVISAPPPGSGARCETHGSGLAGVGVMHSATCTPSFRTCTVV